MTRVEVDGDRVYGLTVEERFPPGSIVRITGPRPVWWRRWFLREKQRDEMLRVVDSGRDWIDLDGIVRCD